METVQTEYFFFYLYLIFLLNIYYSKYLPSFPASPDHVHRPWWINEKIAGLCTVQTYFDRFHMKR